jgi:phosphinothricin acetyltransferase
VTLKVRDSVDPDLAAITALYGLSVETAAGSFEYEPPTPPEMARRRAAVLELGLPWLVAELDGAVAGYAYAGAFRMRLGYRFTVEDSVYVDPAFGRRGVGRALLCELIARCETLGLRQMVAVIGDSGNAASIALHAACGFLPAGTIHDVGWKLDGWRDVVFMQRALGPGASTPPSGTGLNTVGV